MDLKSDATYLYDTEIISDEPMKKHCLLGVGGNAKYFAKVKSLYSLNTLLALTRKLRLPVKTIGNGTNILVSDKGFDGLIISLEYLRDVYFSGDTVRAMAGANIKDVISFSSEHNLVGLEPLCGIPASVGGATVMNAGAFGVCISDYIQSVETLYNGKLIKYDRSQCGFSYRKSIFQKRKQPITSVYFRFPNGNCGDKIKEYGRLRSKSQPAGRSCGSVFQNPKGKFAGELIDSCGLKGYSVGNVSVSDKHANFLSITGKVTANEIYGVIQHVKDTVFSKTGILLKEEVEYLGEF